MIYTTQEGQSFDAEELRKELVAAIGADGWFINTQGNTVMVLQDGDTVYFNPETVDDVVEAHFANGLTRESNKAILKQIADLEATQTPRRIREGGQWLVDLEAQIAALRGELK